jgi:hypothetical protein
LHLHCQLHLQVLYYRLVQLHLDRLLLLSNQMHQLRPVLRLFREFLVSQWLLQDQLLQLIQMHQLRLQMLLYPASLGHQLVLVAQLLL